VEESLRGLLKGPGKEAFRSDIATSIVIHCRGEWRREGLLTLNGILEGGFADRIPSEAGGIFQDLVEGGVEGDETLRAHAERVAAYGGGYAKECAKAYVERFAAADAESESAGEENPAVQEP
jgi:hypothetical protein